MFKAVVSRKNYSVFVNVSNLKVACVQCFPQIIFLYSVSNSNSFLFLQVSEAGKKGWTDLSSYWGGGGGGGGRQKVEYEQPTENSGFGGGYQG